MATKTRNAKSVVELAIEDSAETIDRIDGDQAKDDLKRIACLNVRIKAKGFEVDRAQQKVKERKGELEALETELFELIGEVSGSIGPLFDGREGDE